jgi:Domain of unknown function (DUF1707)
MAGPGDELAAAGTGSGNLLASQADREQTVEMLKVAFVQERLTKDEFDLRVGRTLGSRTCAELAAVTADIPAGLIGYQLQRTPVRAQARPPMSTAAKAGICVAMAIAVPAVMALAWGPVAPFLFAPFYFMALLVAGAQMLASRHDKRSHGQLPPRPSPRTDGPQRPAAAEGGQPPQVNPARRRTAEATRSRLRRPQWPGARPAHQRRPRARGYAIGYPGH